MKPERTLLLCAVDALVASGKLDIMDTTELPDIISVEFEYPNGTPGIAHGRSIGHGEVTIAALYDTKNINETKWISETSGHPSSLKKTLGVHAFSKGWLERKRGKYLMDGKILSSISRNARLAIKNFEIEVQNRERLYNMSGPFIF